SYLKSSSNYSFSHTIPNNNLLFGRSTPLSALIDSLMPNPRFELIVKFLRCVKY
ncbi:hypothetical protein CHS0354_033769, partial [Potamilus streckersoni]